MRCCWSQAWGHGLTPVPTPVSGHSAIHSPTRTRLWALAHVGETEAGRPTRALRSRGPPAGAGRLGSGPGRGAQLGTEGLLPAPGFAESPRGTPPGVWQARPFPAGGRHRLCEHTGGLVQPRGWGAGRGRRGAGGARAAAHRGPAGSCWGHSRTVLGIMRPGGVWKGGLGASWGRLLPRDEGGKLGVQRKRGRLRRGSGTERRLTRSREPSTCCAPGPGLGGGHSRNGTPHPDVGMLAVGVESGPQW